MTSLAATPAAFRPVSSTRIVVGTLTRTSSESHAQATSVVPIPNARAPQRARMRRVRVGAHDDLSGQGIALEDDGVADPVAGRVEPDPLRPRERLLPRRETVGEREEAAPLPLLRHDLPEEREVIAEEEHALRPGDPGLGPHLSLEERSRPSA